MTAFRGDSADAWSKNASSKGSGDIKEITGSETSRSASSDAPIMEVVGVLNVCDVTGEPEAKSKLFSLGLVNRRPRKPKSSSEAAVEPQREARPKRVDSGLTRFMSQEDIDVHIDKKKMDSVKAQQPSPPPTSRAVSKALSRTLSGSPKFKRKSSNLTPCETTQPIKRKESIKRYNSLKLRRKTTDQSETSEQPPLPKRSDSITRYNSLKLRRKASSGGEPYPVPEGSAVVPEGSAVIPEGSAVIPEGSAVIPEVSAEPPSIAKPRKISTIRIKEPARSTVQALLPKSNYRSAKGSATTVLVPKSTPLSSPELNRATSAPSEATKQTIDLWRKMGSNIEPETQGEDYTVVLHMESRAEEADGTVRSTRLVVAKSPRAQPPSATPLFLRNGQSPMLLRKSSASSQPPVYFLDRGSLREEGLREQAARRDREDTQALACSSCCLPIV
ncbi:MAG: uncharacterized protein KVP18_000526 [Porospora cf. gigantea A]|uniref:uncharacterized protein n=1 Tax=Porospora cf. gigantea A TaxID=2853593 RepID=UPI00355A22AF|nr:MAG: hypothetical protein KVP18_000526 [Porospora cf. gigantea A]